MPELQTAVAPVIEFGQVLPQLPQFVSEFS
jgi:hypothetical protein